MKKQQKAFTLVELIVVITILAILGTIAFISMEGYSKSSRDSVRISDVSNMKTSLELFHLNAGKYPLPDNNEIVDYGGETLWYQGKFGSIVVSNLSRNLNEVPTDPLTDKEYIFSVTNNRNEFQILSLLEGNLALNSINQTNAANLTVTPRIDGTYNGVFIKTAGYIVPTPSIVTAEEITEGAGMTLNGTNIKSQVTNLGTNIPNVGNVVSNTGGLDIALSVYTGSVVSDDTATKKAEIMQAIQGAYTGSSLANSDIYKYILSVSGETELAALLDTVVLNGSTSSSSGGDDTPVITLKTVVDCTISGELIYGTEDGTDTGLTCEHDIIVCDGAGSGYVIQACNLGSTMVGTDATVSGGKYFQWGNNAAMTTGTTTSGSQINASGYGPGNYYNDLLFRYGSPDWSSSRNDNLWGNNGSVEDRQGPCSSGYHIPTNSEWSGLNTLGISGSLWGSTDGINLTNKLKLPRVGYLDWGNGSQINLTYRGYYLTSSNNAEGAYYLYFYNGYIGPNDYAHRAYGCSVRCFKN